MRFTLAVLGVFALLANAAPQSLGSSIGVRKACKLFAGHYPDQTFALDSSGHEISATATAFDVKNPSCVFAPQDAQQVAFAVKTCVDAKAKFAVRAGSHVPVTGEEPSVDPGVLVVMAALKTLELCDDTKVLSVGAGNEWQNVYEYLDPHGLTVVGGHDGQMGISATLQGGGISLYSNQYGFASDNVVKFECVLADGAVVEASANNKYSDLFWALKGGGNSFCIITRFDLRTFSSPAVYMGTGSFASYFCSGFLDAIYNFAEYGALDAKAAVIPSITTTPSTNETVYRAMRFYDAEHDVPQTWQNFTPPHIVAIPDTYKYQKLAGYLEAATRTVDGQLRQERRTFSVVVCPEAITTIHDSFLEKTTVALASYENIVASITFKLVTPEAIRQGDINGGNPLGINIVQTPLYIVALQISHKTDEEGVAAKAFVQSFYNEVTEKLLYAGSLAAYVSMNDAGMSQNVFSSYGHNNLNRLIAIRAKYDPSTVFTKWMPDGWKLLNI